MPETMVFATKQKLATGLIARAIMADVPFAWIAADSVYGVGAFETALRRAGKGYMLGVNANHAVRSWHPNVRLAAEASAIADGFPSDAWVGLSAGHGTEGAVRRGHALIRWSVQQIRRLAEKLAGRFMPVTHILAWSIPDAPTRPQHDDHTSKAKCNCRASLGVSVCPHRWRRCPPRPFPTIS